MPPKRAALIGLGIVGLLFGTCAVTGTSLVPTTLALGPCLKDWTSPSTYRPRTSPLASLDLPVDGGTVRLCYGRPSARGRQVFGGLVPYGELWRTGANEPTRLYTGRPIVVAGVLLEPGRYSIYSRPGTDRWEIFFSRSTLHWGNDLSESVRKGEVGQATVPVELLAAPVETLTVRSEPRSGVTDLLLEWERTRIRLVVQGPPDTMP